MNKDFHYEGTYCAALQAGLSQECAREIATAAQMVDDCTKSYMKDNKYSGEDYIPTCMTLTEEMWGAVKSKDYSLPENREELQELRRIWMPFHFLPGNLDGRREYEGVKNYGGKDFYAPDVFDFHCLCLHNSELAGLMVQDTQRIVAGELGDGAIDVSQHRGLLHLIGIRMHVLADTWAHEFFTGAPNYWINGAESFQKLDGTPMLVSELGTPNLGNLHHIFFLGHGRAGGYPDDGVLSYSYKPHWTKDGQHLIKNNPYNFQCAYIQMVEAMRYIMSGAVPGGFVLEEDKALKEKFEAGEDAVYKGVVRRITGGAYQEIIEDIPEYSLEGFAFDDFQERAKYHLSFVEDYLAQKGIAL